MPRPETLCLPCPGEMMKTTCMHPAGASGRGENDTLYGCLQAYTESDIYPFHMPGHKRRPAFLGGERSGGAWIAPSGSGIPDADQAAALCDITEVDGFDNLHAPEGIIQKEMAFAAGFYGTAETFFSVNGSTCAILAAISAAVPRGGTILIERSCHISVYHAAYLRELHVLYLPQNGEELCSAAAGSCASGRKADAIVITSPSYEGFVKDVRRYAESARAIGAVLIVDEAHGAHFSMHPYFPESAVRCGADLVIQSTHKTLPALTQTALLHNVTGAVSGEKLQRFLDIYETSSPSYVLMASLTRCIHAVAEGGSGAFETYTARLKKLRESLAVSLRHLRLAGAPCEIAAGRYDPGKILILTEGTALRENDGRTADPAMFTGGMLYKELLENYHLQPEMKLQGAVLLMTSAADTQEGFDRLERALLEIDSTLIKAPQCALPEKSRDMENFSLPLAAMRLSEAADLPSERVPLDEAEGRIAAEYVIQYPPDTPLVVPGEVYSRALIRRIGKLLDAGFTLTGLSYSGNGTAAAVIR